MQVIDEETVDFGSVRLTSYDGETYWMESETGEGQQISKLEFQSHLKNFFDERM